MITVNCSGLHCEGCGKAGISLGGLGVLAAALVAIAKRHAIEHGADEAVHVLFVTAVIAACVAAVAIVSVVMVRLNRTARVVSRCADEMTEMTSRPVIRVTAEEVTRPALEARPSWPHTDPYRARDRDEVKR